MRSKVLMAAAAVAVVSWSCGGSSYAPSPQPPTGGGGGANSTITIVGNKGNQSFSPNPATAAQGTTVAFMNSDGVTHHIRAVDGSFDSGNLSPGSTSGALTVTTDGANYYCTIHPSMVGSIKASGGSPPPCIGLYCGDR